MQKLAADITLQQESLLTKKYVLSKFPEAVIQKLAESGEEVYQTKADPEKFPFYRFVYDAHKAAYFVRPFTRLKRKGRPDILVYSVFTYPASSQSIIQILNEYGKGKKFSELPNSIQSSNPTELVVRMTGPEVRMLSILGNQTVGGRTLRKPGT